MEFFSGMFAIHKLVDHEQSAQGLFHFFVGELLNVYVVFRQIISVFNKIKRCEFHVNLAVIKVIHMLSEYKR